MTLAQLTPSRRDRPLDAASSTARAREATRLAVACVGVHEGLRRAARLVQKTRESWIVNRGSQRFTIHDSRSASGHDPRGEHDSLRRPSRRRRPRAPKGNAVCVGLYDPRRGSRCPRTCVIATAARRRWPRRPLPSKSSAAACSTSWPRWSPWSSRRAALFRGVRSRGNGGAAALLHWKTRDLGLLTILDGKRNDIASTATAYADATFGGTRLRRPRPSRLGGRRAHGQRVSPAAMPSSRSWRVPAASRPACSCWSAPAIQRP